MRSFLVYPVSIALVLGCHSTTSTADAPFLRGIITSREPILAEVVRNGITVDTAQLAVG
jgi:hypothetical protein